MQDLEESYLNGHPTNRLPGNLNISFAYVEGESLLMGMKDIALSLVRFGLYLSHIGTLLRAPCVGGRDGFGTFLDSFRSGPFQHGR